MCAPETIVDNLTTLEVYWLYREKNVTNQQVLNSYKIQTPADAPEGGSGMGELSELLNIGPAVEGQLNQVGITTYEQLKDMGSKQAWLKIKSIDESACIHRLLSLEGAIRRVKKSQLPPEVKEELREFYRAVKSQDR